MTKKDNNKLLIFGGVGILAYLFLKPKTTSPPPPPPPTSSTGSGDTIETPTWVAPSGDPTVEDEANDWLALYNQKLYEVEDKFIGTINNAVAPYYVRNGKKLLASTFFGSLPPEALTDQQEYDLVINNKVVVSQDFINWIPNE